MRLIATMGLGVLLLLAATARFTTNDPWRLWAIHLPLMVVLASTLYLTTTGRPQLAVVFFTVATFAVAVVAFFALGGLHGNFVVTLPTLVAVTGTIWNRRAAIVVSAALVAMMLLALVLEASGMLPVTTVQTTTLHTFLRATAAIAGALTATVLLRRMGETAARNAGQSETRYALLIDQAPDAHVFMDRERRVRYMNPATKQLVGYTLDDFRDRKFEELPIFPEAFRAAAARAYDTLLTQAEGPPAPPREAEVIHRDGTRVQVEVNRRPVVVSGEVRGLQYTIRDISERKRAELTRARLEADLQESRRLESIGRLAGGVAHDFNNLLTVILGQSQLLLYQSPSQEVRDQLTPIIQAADRARNLIRQLLAFARKQNIAPRVIDPNQVIADLESLLRTMTGSRIKLVLHLDPTAGLVRIDPSQLDQVITNLTANARDAVMGEGSVVIETRGQGQSVVISVTDDGSGISDEVRARMFEPFFTTKPPGHGTGLGLAVVDGIVSQNGGTVRVESTPGKGAKLIVTLPKADADTASPVPAARPA